MKKFLLCGIILVVIFIGWCRSSEQKAYRDLNICQRLVEQKDKILSDYAWYYTATMKNITSNPDFSSLSWEDLLALHENLIIDLTQKSEELTKKYINSLYLPENETESFNSKYSKIGSKTKNSWNKGMDAPDFCSNEESYEIKNLDDIYINFYWCFVNSEMAEDYWFNLIACSIILTESYYWNNVDVHDLYNWK